MPAEQPSIIPPGCGRPTRVDRTPVLFMEHREREHVSGDDFGGGTLFHAHKLPRGLKPAAPSGESYGQGAAWVETPAARGVEPYGQDTGWVETPAAPLGDRGTGGPGVRDSLGGL